MAGGLQPNVHRCQKKSNNLGLVMRRLAVKERMDAFVWTKIGIESGEILEQIVSRKNAERLAGGGQFWWGIGSSLGLAVRSVAREQGGSLPVLFSMMRSRPKAVDTKPNFIWIWTSWED